MSWPVLVVVRVGRSCHHGVALSALTPWPGPSASVEHIELQLDQSIDVFRPGRIAVTSECHLRRMFLLEPR